MATFSYAGIDFAQPRTVNYHRRVRSDGPTYLWTEHTLHVRGIYHPGQTSYSIQGNAAAVVKEAGNNPSETDSRIRHQLSQHRQHLVYSTAGTDAGGAPALFVDGLPAPGGSLLVLDVPPSKNPIHPDLTNNPANWEYLTDCNNGPLVVANDVRQIGMRTWEVELVVKVHLSECYNFYSNLSPVLSHRWSMHDDIDRFGFATRTTRGHAIFRTDRLIQLAAVPDDFREDLLAHQVPTNFQRVHSRVRVHEDNNRLDYTFVDKECSHNLLPNHVTRLEARVRVIHDAAGLSEGMKAGFGAIMAILGRNPGDIARALMNAVEAVVPRLRFVFSIRAYGNRFSTRVELADVAEKVLELKFPGYKNKGILREHVEREFDLVGRYAGIFAVFSTDAFASLEELFNEGGTGLSAKYKEVLQEDIADIAVVANTAGRRQAGGLASASALEELTAAGLTAPCKSPGAPSLRSVSGNHKPVNEAT